MLETITKVYNTDNSGWIKKTWHHKACAWVAYYSNSDIKKIEIHTSVKNVILKEKNMNIFSSNCDNALSIIVKSLLVWVIDYFIDVFRHSYLIYQEEVTSVPTSAALIIDHLKELFLYVKSDFISMLIRVGYLLMASFGMYCNFWIWNLIFWKLFSAILWYRKWIHVDMSCRVV